MDSQMRRTHPGKYTFTAYFFAFLYPGKPEWTILSAGSVAGFAPSAGEVL